MIQNLFIWPVMFAMAIGTSPAFAHYIWVVSESGKARIVFGEGLDPDKAEFLDGISAMRVFRTNGNEIESVTFDRMSESDMGWFQFANAEDSPVLLTCDYGIFTRGEKSMRLDYAARYQRSNAEIAIVDDMRLDIRPTFENGNLILTAYFDGRPASNIELVITQSSVDSAALTATTDENGRSELTWNGENRVLIRGKTIIEQDGNIGGKNYTEHRYYCTVVFDVVPSEVGRHETVKLPFKLPDLPVAITSFGAAMNGDSIYVFGGQMGEPHAYAKSWQNGELLCLDLSSSLPSWKAIEKQSGVQGLALVEHGNRLYRIGGFEARNAVGEEHDLHSLAAFCKFDLETKKWIELSPLPQPRSSFDACVVGNKIYVIGGWSLRGSEPAVWCDSALEFDLAASDGNWKELAPPPFRRRALGVVAHGQKLFAIGGIGEDGQTSTAVSVFDLHEGKWQSRASIPECGELKGFGCCAFTMDNSVFVSVSDGQFFSYTEDEDKWTRRPQHLIPGRFFHRILPRDDSSVFVLGGANMDIGRFAKAEVIEIKPGE